MRILIAHNRYQQAGGEDAVAKSEAALLRDFGEDVHVYERSNQEIERYTRLAQLRHFFSLSWSQRSYREMRKLLRDIRPEVVHFHNTFFMMTPSVYYACRDEHIPIVQSLHNFRLLCANGLFFRDNHVCEECPKHSLWRGVQYGCYRQSRLLTSLVVKMLTDHWRKKTWTHLIDRYLTATEFSRQKFIERGISPDKISVKPNFLYPDVKRRDKDQGYALYVGRLSREKGVEVLLRAWQLKAHIPLKIVGDGPLAGRLGQERGYRNLEFLGYVSKEKYAECMRGAKFLIVPSLCYENFPRILVEAYAYGVPVIASRLGGMPEIVLENKTGLLFEPGDAYDLINKIHWLLEHEEDYRKFEQSAREEFEQKYSAQKSYQGLMNVYKQII